MNYAYKQVRQIAQFAILAPVFFVELVSRLDMEKVRYKSRVEKNS